MNDLTTKAQGDGGELPQRPKVTSGITSNREMIIAQQVGTLMALASTCVNALKLLVPGDDDASVGDKAKYSLETTLMTVNNRIQSILIDDDRWTMAGYNDLADKLRELYAKQRELFDAQKELADSQRAPHLLLGAKYVRLPNGAWAVWLGNPAIPNGCITAVGVTLKEAMQNFDDRFNATPTEDQRRIYEQAKTWTVDAGGIGGIQQTGNPERQAGDDSQRAKPDAPIRNVKVVGNPPRRKRSRRN